MGLRPDFRDIAKDVFYYAGMPGFLLWLLRLRRHPNLVIFTYHRICPSAERRNYLSVPRDVFEEHVRFIKDNFKVVALRDGLKALEEGDSKRIYAAINLDDGYMDNYLYAYPVLRKYGVPATIFLATDFIGKGHILWWDRVFNIVPSFDRDGISRRQEMTDRINADLKRKGQDQIERSVKELEDRYPSAKRAEPVQMLGWKEIKEMNKGGISFGSHTKTHRNLCLLDDDELERELVDSKREIEDRLGIDVEEFTYPFGIFDDRVKGFVEKAGFKCARTSSKGVNQKSSDRFSLASIGADGLLKPGHLASRVSINAFKGRI